MRLIIIAVLALWPLLARAEITVPALMQVSGVPVNDTLNVRALPNGASDDIGDLQNGDMVEITALNGQWGQIAWQESNGWVSLRFLTAIARPTAPDSDMPLGLACTGTEPFWSSDLKPDGQIDFWLGGHYIMNQPIAHSANSGGYANQFAFETLNGTYTGVLKQQQCDDGMSERISAWQLDIVQRLNGNISLFSGCCSVPGTGN